MNSVIQSSNLLCCNLELLWLTYSTIDNTLKTDVSAQNGCGMWVHCNILNCTDSLRTQKGSVTSFMLGRWPLVVPLHEVVTSISTLPLIETCMLDWHDWVPELVPREKWSAFKMERLSYPSDSPNQHVIIPMTNFFHDGCYWSTINMLIRAHRGLLLFARLHCTDDCIDVMHLFATFLTGSLPTKWPFCSTKSFPNTWVTTLCFCHFTGDLAIEPQFSIRDRHQLHFWTNPIPMQCTHSASVFTASVLREELEHIPGRWHSMTARGHECTFWAFVWCATPWLTFYDYHKRQARIMDMCLAAHFLI